MKHILELLMSVAMVWMGAHGEPASCGQRLVSGLFTRRALPLGYSLVATVPASACRLNVTELQPSGNHIALRLANGAFVVNGAFAVSASGTYEAAGARFVYRRGARDSIVADGPLMQPIDIMILCQKPNQGIAYEYLTKASEVADESKARVPENRQPSETGAIPEKKLAATNGERRAVWRLAGFAPCSKTCGGGVQTALWRCVEIGTDHEVDAKACGAAPTARRRRCGRAACGPRWRTGPWTDCPICGPANRTRTVECVQEYHRTINRLNEDKCSASRPASWRPCTVAACARTRRPRLHSDTFHDASSALVSKLSNFSHAVEARKEHSNEVHRAKIDIPEEWLYTEWSKCTAPCGSGIQTRASLCTSQCGTAPQVRRTCHSQCDDQPAVWFTGPWSTCSSSCGGGARSRAVLCVVGERVVGAAACPRMRPAHLEACASSVPCSAEWFAGEWSQCTGICGKAEQTRTIRCSAEKQATCRSVLPPVLRACTPAYCVTALERDKDTSSPMNSINRANRRDEQPRFSRSHNKGDCQDKISACSLAVQARLCQYNYYNQNCCKSCESVRL